MLLKEFWILFYFHWIFVSSFGFVIVCCERVAQQWRQVTHPNTNAHLIILLLCFFHWIFYELGHIVYEIYVHNSMLLFWYYHCRCTLKCSSVLIYHIPLSRCRMLLYTYNTHVWTAWYYFLIDECSRIAIIVNGRYSFMSTIALLRYSWLNIKMKSSWFFTARVKWRLSY